ncbi:DUF4166 domain-containing protein [Lysobacter firmicutimachus]|uniref:DUF4166 domain-containing protein n=1 Tax=Lysobacter firmicutimachus TaxID=1792846 RepID=A0ABU8CZ65_9GAMM
MQQPPARDAARLGAREGLYPRALGVRFVFLPPTLRRIHGSAGRRSYRGEAQVERGQGLCARLFSRIARLPKAHAGPIEVEIDARARAETWTRRFGKSAMRSRLIERDGLVLERLGPMRFGFALDLVGDLAEASASGVMSLDGGAQVTVVSAVAPAPVERLGEDGSEEPGLSWRLVRVRALGLPLPARWFAGVRAREFERDGRYHFDVAAQLPAVGLLVRYRGWLDVGE